MPHSQERDGDEHPRLVQTGILPCTHTETALWRSARDMEAFCQQTIMWRTLSVSTHGADGGVQFYHQHQPSLHNCSRTKTHIHTLYPTVKEIGPEKNLQNSRFGCRLWGQDEQPRSVAAPRADSASHSRWGSDRSCRYMEERTSTKGCVVLSAGKGKGKAQESCKPGWERSVFGCDTVPHAFTEQ